MILDGALELENNFSLPGSGVPSKNGTNYVDMRSVCEPGAGKPLYVVLHALQTMTESGSAALVQFNVQIANNSTFSLDAAGNPYTPVCSPMFGAAVHFLRGFPLQFQWHAMAIPPTDPAILDLVDAAPRFMRIQYFNRSLNTTADFCTGSFRVYVVQELATGLGASALYNSGF